MDDPVRVGCFGGPSDPVAASAFDGLATVYYLAGLQPVMPDPAFQPATRDDRFSAGCHVRAMRGDRYRAQRPKRDRRQLVTVADAQPTARCRELLNG